MTQNREQSGRPPGAADGEDVEAAGRQGGSPDTSSGKARGPGQTTPAPGGLAGGVDTGALSPGKTQNARPL